MPEADWLRRIERILRTVFPQEGSTFFVRALRLCRMGEDIGIEDHHHRKADSFCNSIGPRIVSRTSWFFSQ
jgi:hypothetical protein